MIDKISYDKGMIRQSATEYSLESGTLVSSRVPGMIIPKPFKSRFNICHGGRELVGTVPRKRGTQRVRLGVRIIQYSMIIVLGVQYSI
jgi:hypothetical protein